MRNALSRRRLAHASLLLLACWLMLKNTFALDGSEFSGGRVTGPILTMADVGLIAFVVALLLAYPLPRISSLITLLASLLSFPLLLYFIAPGPFRAVFRGEYSVPLESNFVWHRWSLEPAIVILIVTAISAWNLFPLRRRQADQSVAHKR